MSKWNKEPADSIICSLKGPWQLALCIQTEYLFIKKIWHFDSHDSTIMKCVDQQHKNCNYCAYIFLFYDWRSESITSSNSISFIILDNWPEPPHLVCTLPGCLHGNAGSVVLWRQTQSCHGSNQKGCLNKCVDSYLTLQKVKVTLW